MPTTPTKQDGAAEQTRAAFEAWFEPDEENRRTLRSCRTEDGYAPANFYLCGCWAGWSARDPEVSALLSEVAALRKALEGIAAVKFSVKADDSLSYKAAYWEEIALTQQLVAREALEAKQ